MWLETATQGRSAERFLTLKRSGSGVSGGVKHRLKPRGSSDAQGIPPSPSTAQLKGNRGGEEKGQCSMRGRADPLGLSCPDTRLVLTQMAAEVLGFEALLPGDGAETKRRRPAETGKAAGC